MNCGVIDNVASQCVENPVRVNFAFSRADTEAAGIAAQTITAEDDRVLFLHPAEQPLMRPPLTRTCGRNKFKPV